MKPQALKPWREILLNNSSYKLLCDMERNSLLLEHELKYPFNLNSKCFRIISIVSSLLQWCSTVFCSVC